jgi:hypothetical protein
MLATRTIDASIEIKSDSNGLRQEIEQILRDPTNWKVIDLLGQRLWTIRLLGIYSKKTPLKLEFG